MGELKESIVLIGVVFSLLIGIDLGRCCVWGDVGKLISAPKFVSTTIEKHYKNVLLNNVLDFSFIPSQNSGVLKRDKVTQISSTILSSPQFSSHTLDRYIEYLEEQSESLRKGLPHRGKSYQSSSTVRTTIDNCLDISERPEIEEERAEA